MEPKETAWSRDTAHGGGSKNDDGDNVFCVKVPHGDSLSIKVKNLAAPEKEDRIMKFQAHHRDDEFFYIWLPCGDYEFFNGTDLYHATIEENIYKANVPRALVEYSEVEKSGDGYIDLSEKDIEFTD